MIFQLANVLAHRSLGDVQLQRCTGEVQVPCGGFKRSQGIERQVHDDVLLIRQALFVNLARAEVSKPLDGLKLNGIGTLQ